MKIFLFISFLFVSFCRSQKPSRHFEHGGFAQSEASLSMKLILDKEKRQEICLKVLSEYCEEDGSLSARLLSLKKKDNPREQKEQKAKFRDDIESLFSNILISGVFTWQVVKNRSRAFLLLTMGKDNFDHIIDRTKEELKKIGYDEESFNVSSRLQFEILWKEDASGVSQKDLERINKPEDKSLDGFLDMIYSTH